MATTSSGAVADWKPVSTIGSLVCIVLGFAALIASSVGDRWVPLLDHANLVFHEAGHVILGMLSDRFSVYGGTLGQFAFPVATAVAFRRRRDPLACGFALFWIAQNACNVATYLGDARAMQLPLIGGMDPESAHDWREILMRWGMLAWDTRLAGLVRLFAFLLGLATATWLVLRRQAAPR
jgi:hypothetical protein